MKPIERAGHRLKISHGMTASCSAGKDTKAIREHDNIAWPKGLIIEEFGDRV
jgi:hypothetical protein